jgi:hypothetical protein
LEGSENRDRFLLSDTYQIASEMAFYVPGQPQTYNVNLGRRMNQYDLWGGLEQLRDRDGLFVIGGDFNAPPALGRPVRRCASSEQSRPSIAAPSAGFSIFECDGYRGIVEDRREVSY